MSAVKKNKYPLLELNVRRSECCNYEVSEVPAYYTTTMKTNDGKDIPMEAICLKCGCRCSTGFFN